MKRVYSLGTVVLLSTSLVVSGCGSNNKANESSPSNSATPSASSSASNGSGEKVKLTMGSWRTDDKAVYEKVFAEFNKQYPNIEIDFSPTKSTEYNTVLNTALQTGEGPDIIHLRPYAAGIGLGDSGFIEPINGLPGLEVFPADVMAASTGKDGNVYGVPMALNTVGIMYNKKIFKDNNLEVPKTWDELLKVSQSLKDNKIIPFGFGAKDGWILSMTQGAIGPAGYGGNEFVDKLLKGEKKFTDEEYVQSLQLMKDLVPYFPDKFTGIGYEDMRTFFATEQAAMYVLGDFDVGVIQTMNPALELGVFPIPSKVAGASPTVSTYVDGSYAVNAASKHKEEAKKFLEFATSKEFGNLFANEMKRVSPIPGVTATDPVIAQFAELANTASTPYLMVTNFNSGNPTTKVTLENSMQALYLNNMDAKKVAEELQKNVDTWFKP
ncbi:ABC transporter substrate-binding protein [Cohnella abietis]|uniref:Sugar ABC transporter substrate-binding protein n=1 Tax=Cohnella abietis TaxID=2507935 RepID=A0A3T1DF15_9BACL|nr:extracellular solute-binding protein [Cohnella abietis]BBI36485.1 sugar ABC transporter substrate-binding protein [Cohnella abietis]